MSVHIQFSFQNKIIRTDIQFIRVIEDTSFNWRVLSSKKVLFYTCTATGRNTSLKRMKNGVDHLELYRVYMIKK